MKDRIKQLMEAQHMTQQVFADFLGINPATLSGIFNDRTKPTLNIVEAVKKKFPDINLDWLMFGAGSMFRQTSAPANAAKPSEQSPQTPRQQQPTELWSQEAMIDFGNSVSPTPSLQPQTGSHYNSVRNTRQDYGREDLKIFDKPTRRVTEIRVYYDDQTWESFVPAKK
jgi:transcriptional regulator with XRE-family HTH domain